MEEKEEKKGIEARYLEELERRRGSLGPGLPGNQEQNPAMGTSGAQPDPRELHPHQLRVPAAAVGGSQLILRIEFVKNEADPARGIGDRAEGIFVQKFEGGSPTQQVVRMIGAFQEWCGTVGGVKLSTEIKF